MTTEEKFLNNSENKLTILLSLPRMLWNKAEAASASAAAQETIQFQMTSHLYEPKSRVTNSLITRLYLHMSVCVCVCLYTSV